MLPGVVPVVTIVVADVPVVGGVDVVGLIVLGLVVEAETD
jgi:hypothetical protein